MSHTFTTDIAIIGAGPTGLFAVFQAGMLGFKCTLIDSLPEIGGQCTALYPQKPIYDIPAYPSITAGELIEKLEQQAMPFNPQFVLGQSVTTYHFDESTKLFTLETSEGLKIAAKAVVVAAGGGAFGPNRPPLKNIEQYEEKSVFYSVRKPESFANKHVVIAGGGDSAVDWANILADIAASVTVVHRRSKFRAHQDSINKMMHLVDDGKISLCTPYQLHSLVGENGQLSDVVVSDLDGNKVELAADVLLPFFGLRMDLGPLKQWPFDISEKGIVVDPLTMETSIKGTYAIGDVASYPNKLKLILCGFSEAAMAVHAIRAQLHPNHTFHFEHSTTKGVPGS